MTFIPPLPFRLTLMAGAALALSACGGMSNNRLLTPQHQAVVTHATYTFDVSAGPGGLPLPEQKRLAGWFGVFCGSLPVSVASRNT